MNADLTKYKGLSIPQQQQRRRIEFRVNRCRDKRERLKALQLDAGPEFETNEQQLREAENALTKFDGQFAPSQLAADKREPQPDQVETATTGTKARRASQKKRASKKR